MQQKRYLSRPPLGHHLSVALFLVAALSTQAKAASIPSNTTNPTSHSNSTQPISSNDNFALQIQEDMACYALPYGAIGIISHVLTFYSSWCWAAGRAPLKPWTRLHMVKLDAAIFVVSFIVTFSLSVTTLVRCQGTSELQCVAVWKRFLGVTAFAMELFGGVWLPRGEKGGQLSPVTMWTLFMVPYTLSSIAGIAGLAAAVFNYNSSAAQNHGLTPPLPGWLWSCTFCVIIVMGLIVFAMVVAPFFLEHVMNDNKVWRTFKGLVIIIIVVNAIYFDWALAFLANDTIGQGEGKTGQALTWAYFFAKRLPMLSF